MTETIQKEPNHEEKETIKAKTGGYWDDLGQKGKRDAEIKQQLNTIRTKAKHEIFNTEMTSEEFESNFIPDLRSQVKSILELYELPEEEVARRADDLLEEQEELFEYAQMNAYGVISFNSYQAYKIFDGLKASIYECEFKVKEEGIEIRFMDPQRIQLATILFSSSTFRFLQEGTVDMNLNDLTMVLKATKSEKAITTIIFTERKLKITKRSTEQNIPIKDNLAALDLEFEEIPMESLLILEYPFSFELQKQ